MHTNQPAGPPRWINFKAASPAEIAEYYRATAAFERSRGDPNRVAEIYDRIAAETLARPSAASMASTPAGGDALALAKSMFPESFARGALSILGAPTARSESERGRAIFARALGKVSGAEAEAALPAETKRGLTAFRTMLAKSGLDKLSDSGERPDRDASVKGSNVRNLEVERGRAAFARVMRGAA